MADEKVAGAAVPTWHFEFAKLAAHAPQLVTKVRQLRTENEDAEKREDVFLKDAKRLPKEDLLRLLAAAGDLEHQGMSISSFLAARNNEIVDEHRTTLKVFFTARRTITRSRLGEARAALLLQIRALIAEKQPDLAQWIDAVVSGASRTPNPHDIRSFDERLLLDAIHQLDARQLSSLDESAHLAEWLDLPVEQLARHAPTLAEALKGADTVVPDGKLDAAEAAGLTAEQLTELLPAVKTVRAEVFAATRAWLQAQETEIDSTIRIPFPGMQNAKVAKRIAARRKVLDEAMKRLPPGHRVGVFIQGQIDALPYESCDQDRRLGFVLRGAIHLLNE